MSGEASQTGSRPFCLEFALSVASRRPLPAFSGKRGRGEFVVIMIPAVVCTPAGVNKNLFLAAAKWELSAGTTFARDVLEKNFAPRRHTSNTFCVAVAPTAPRVNKNFEVIWPRKSDSWVIISGELFWRGWWTTSRTVQQTSRFKRWHWNSSIFWY